MSIETSGQSLFSKFEAILLATKSSVCLKDTFISQASHQVKTPLTALKLQVEMAKKVLEKEEALTAAQMRSIINRTHHDVIRLSRLLEDMVDVSRINIGKFQMKMDYFNLQNFIEVFCQRVEKEVPGFHKTKLTLNAPVLVYWDKFRVEQALVCLLTHALHFGNSETMEFNAFSGGGNVYFQVRDCESSVPKSVQKKIQKMLAMQESPLDDSRFLGLFIGLMVLKMHKGLVRFESHEGQGTLCELQIPLKP